MSAEDKRVLIFVGVALVIALVLDLGSVAVVHWISNGGKKAESEE